MEGSDVRLGCYVASLSRLSLHPDLELANPYHSETAVWNLSRFLEIDRGHGPRLLFVGEAPGYRGAVLSGVPFASISTLTHPWNDPWGVFGPQSGFRAPVRCQITNEATATVFWKTLATHLSPLPLPFTWNAVPFHPRGEGGRNGAPRRPQLAIGRLWLLDFLELTRPDCIIAVGRQAERSLRGMNIEFVQVRHPSHGGKKDFAAGIARIAHTFLP